MGTIITTKMNRKYLIIAVAVLALGCIGTLQAFTHLETQEPQEIRGIVVDEHDAAWYEQQQTRTTANIVVKEGTSQSY